MSDEEWAEMAPRLRRQIEEGKIHLVRHLPWRCFHPNCDGEIRTLTWDGDRETGCFRLECPKCGEILYS